MENVKGILVKKKQIFLHYNKGTKIKKRTTIEAFYWKINFKRILNVCTVSSSSIITEGMCCKNIV